jgi:Mitochondrial K+-H+ exchange-related
MDVFLVPVAPDRYELYCEEPDEPEPTPDDGTPRPGFFRRMALRFRETLAEAERVRRQGPQPGDVKPSFLGRLKARTLRWVAESIAEQRLLWQLRGKDAVCLISPDDLTEAQARQLLKRSLTRDWEKHRFWLAVDTVGAVGSIALILLPGPNFVGYYFMFRIVGHYFSLRGARQGLLRVTWTVEASAPLSSLRTMIEETPDARADRVHAVASTLRLEHFANFFQRTAIP